MKLEHIEKPAKGGSPAVKDDRLTFPNVSDFFKYTEGEHPEGSWAASGGNQSSRDGRNEWAGGSWEQAVELRKRGWAEGLARAKKTINRIENIIGTMMMEKEIGYDVSGDFLDMGRVMTGEPEAFGFFRDTDDTTTTPYGDIVTIGVNFAISAAVAPETIERRGVAVSALARALEMAGRSVQVDTTWSVHDMEGKQNRLVMVVPVKKAGENLSPEIMAYCTGHPAMLRRHFFAAMEHLPQRLGKLYGCAGGYGYPAGMETEYDVYLPQIHSGEFPNEDSILAFVKDTLIKQGVELEV